MKNKLSTEGLSKKVKDIKQKLRQEQSVFSNNSEGKKGWKNESVKSCLIFWLLKMCLLESAFKNKEVCFCFAVDYGKSLKVTLALHNAFNRQIGGCYLTTTCITVYSLLNLEDHGWVSGLLAYVPHTTFRWVLVVIHLVPGFHSLNSWTPYSQTTQQTRHKH